MQPLLLVDGLWSGIKILLELVAQVNVYFPEGAFAFAEGFEMLIDVLPLGVSGIGLLLEPCEEAAFLLLSVEEVVAFVDDALVATAAQGLGLLAHAVVVVLLALVLRLGIDVDAKAFMSHYLHS